tara:strand:+ start:67084 stop:67776 length:693 start_codon:yes stop_codon:yes gene_type:complete
MKTNLIFGTALLVFTFLTSCNEKKGNHENDYPKEDKEVKAPSQIISIDLAKSEYDNYTKKRAALIEDNEEPYDDGRKFVASRYGDYPIDTLKKYIKFIEQQADSAGVKIETLRFYFSTYSDQKEFPDKRKIKHPRQNSFFILPTMKVDTMNYGFYIKNETNGKKEAALIRDYPGLIEQGMENIGTPNKSHASIIPNFNLNTNSSFFQDNQSLIMNEAQMVPPPPNESDFD